MDLLQQVSTASSKVKDAELARAMYEGTHAYRKKLRLPEMNAHAERRRAEASASAQLILWRAWRVEARARAGQKRCTRLPTMLQLATSRRAPPPELSPLPALTAAASRSSPPPALATHPGCAAFV